MRKWHDVEQNSEAWFELRLGKYTASNYAKVCANMGKAFGVGAVKYSRGKALELVTGNRDITGSFKSAYMERGHELEPIAIELYEDETFNTVGNGGFYEFGNYGDSPDGLVGEKGCIEVKSVIPSVHWERIESENIDLAYKWQIQGHLFVSGREWCDFISYCPEFAEKKRLFVKRVFRNDQMIEDLENRLGLFHELVKCKIKLIS